MSKTTRELSGYAIPRPAAGVMLGALHCRRWEPAGWAGVPRLGTSGPGGARPGEGGQEGGTLPLGKTQHGAFPGRQRTGRRPRRCAWHGEGTRAQPVPSHAGLAPRVTLTRKQSHPPPRVARRGGGRGKRAEEEGRRAGSTGRPRGGPRVERRRVGSSQAPTRGRAGARRPHTLTCPSPCPPARRRLRSAAGRARGRARAHTHTRARPACARARGRAHGFLRARARPAQPQLRSFKAGRALRRSRRCRRAAAMAAPSPESPPRTPDPPRLCPTPRPGPASPPRPRPSPRLQGGATCCLQALPSVPRPRSLLAQ